MKSSLGSILLRVGVSFGLLGFIVYSLRHKLDEAVHILQHEVQFPWFLLAIVTYGVAIAVLSVRLRDIFRIQKIMVTFLEACYLSFIGLFFNLFLPSAVGGDVAKAYYAYKHCGNKLTATSGVLTDRILGFVTMIFMALAAFLIFSKELEEPRIAYIVFGFLAIVVLTVLFFASKRVAGAFKPFKVFVPSKWQARLSEFYHSIHNYRNHPGVLLYLLLISVAAQSLFVLVHYFATLSLGVSLNIWLFFVLVPMIAIVSMAPSLGGLGVREAGLIYFFSRFMPAERALALSILVDFVLYGYSLGAGIVYAFQGELKAKTVHEMEEIQ